MLQCKSIFLVWTNLSLKHFSRPGLAASLEQTTLLSRSDGPKYDASYLAELKANTNSSRPPTDAYNEEDRGVVDTEMTFDASEMDGAVIENLNDLPLMTESITTETVIPSESTIKSVREKRDRIRKTGATEADFISLSVAKREDFASGPHPGSRLMREDDDLGEGDDGRLFELFWLHSLHTFRSSRIHWGSRTYRIKQKRSQNRSEREKERNG